MVILCITGGTIYGLPYTFEILYIPMQQAMSLTKTQMGGLMGLFAAIPAVIAYNRYSQEIDRFISRYESFSEEFMGVLQRQAGKSLTQHQAPPADGETDVADFIIAATGFNDVVTGSTF